jgi:hypothetical protein
MKPESSKKIIDAYFDVFDELSLKTFNQGFGFVLDSFEESLRSLRPIRTREGFLAKLLKDPEPEPFELDAQVEMIYLLPYTIRKVMPEAMHEFSQTLPHDPGGRPRVFNEKESRYVCQEIGKLIAHGVSRLEAQGRLARRMSQEKGQDISLRSVQRAWQNRKQWFETDSENSKSLGKRIAEKLRGR